MQHLKNTNFYSNTTSKFSLTGPDDVRTNQIGVGVAFEDERQVLVQEQKLCRTQARLLSVETNRRRKVLEERRRQWDVQEQTLRENILLQRKQRVQDVTERFQRAHLPLSQRRRHTFRKNTPDVEEALNYIKGNLNLSSFARQSSFLSSNLTISRSCSPSPKPLTDSPSLHHRNLSVQEGFTKLGEDRTISPLLFLNELQGTHLGDGETCHSPQDHLTHSSQSSLSSQDSLENQDVTHRGTNNKIRPTPETLRRFLLDHLDQQVSWSDSTHRHSEGGFLSDNLPPRGIRTDELSGDRSSRLHCGCGATGGQSLTNKLSLHTDTVTPPPVSVTPVPVSVTQLPVSVTPPPVSVTPPPVSVTLPPGSVTQPPVSVTPPPVSVTSEHSLLTVPGPVDRASLQPGCAKQHAQESDPGDVVAAGCKSSNPDSLLLQFTSCQTPEERLDLRQHVKTQEEQDFKHPLSTLVSLFGKNCIHKVLLCEASNLSPGPVLSSEVKDTHVSLESTQHPSHRRKYYVKTRADFTQDSKSEPRAGRGSLNPAPIGPTACHSDIRSDFPKGLQQEHIQSPPPSLPSSNTSHPSGCTEVRFIKGILKKQPKSSLSREEARTRLYSASHLTKQVAISIRDSVELTRMKVKSSESNGKVKKKIRWLDEEILKEEEKEINPDDHLKDKPTAPPHYNHQSHLLPRAHTTSPGFHFTKQAWADVGVQERGQEARETRAEVRGQRGNGGRPECPRAPRRVRSARVGTGPVPSCSRKGRVIRAQTASEANRHVVRLTQGKITVPQPPPREDPAQTRIIKAGSGGGVFMPLSSSRAHASSSTATPTSGQRVAQEWSAMPGLLYHDKGLCLKRTPTDEEISQLWHGVRRALSTKDDKGMVRRPAQESCGSRRRGAPGSGNKSLIPSQSQALGPMITFQTKYDLTYQDEDSEYAAEAGSEMVVAMETLQPQRPPPGPPQQRSYIQGQWYLQQGQYQGLTTISMEEQKVLLSLDRLNHRLQYVQEFVGGNPTAKAVLQGNSTFLEERLAADSRKPCSFSTDNRSRTQNRYGHDL
ncbi:hypothetical protein DPEC_G00296700 [Dallia pectoralis]|uniref:Uncharacterized protein n=1 Tax=Dallia pectoralis TaxID=75939 RepID=A0ACC2FFJ0_DALPE|nr:hypothetical protein DPEC_G00296700 [Dallia pectoralis]